MVVDNKTENRLKIEAYLKPSWVLASTNNFFLIIFFSLRMSGLDSEMEKEIDDLRRRYHAKRQPILDAMDQKRKRQQNF
jgi:hypothetical protein